MVGSEFLHPNVAHMLIEGNGLGCLFGGKVCPGQAVLG